MLVPISSLASLSLLAISTLSSGANAACPGNCIHIYRGVHLASGANSGGTVGAKFNVLNLPDSASGTVAGCRPGTGSQGKYLFYGHHNGGLATTQGDMRVRGGSSQWTTAAEAYGDQPLEFACLNALG
ncbi:unnamed protein product [Jaminaea pallidilutea]